MLYLKLIVCLLAQVYMMAYRASNINHCEQLFIYKISLFYEENCDGVTGCCHIQLYT